MTYQLSVGVVGVHSEMIQHERRSINNLHFTLTRITRKSEQTGGGVISDIPKMQIGAKIKTYKSRFAEWSVETLSRTWEMNLWFTISDGDLWNLETKWKIHHKNWFIHCILLEVKKIRSNGCRIALGTSTALSSLKKWTKRERKSNTRSNVNITVD